MRNTQTSTIDNLPVRRQQFFVPSIALTSFCIQFEIQLRMRISIPAMRKLECASYCQKPLRTALGTELLAKPSTARLPKICFPGIEALFWCHFHYLSLHIKIQPTNVILTVFLLNRQKVDTSPRQKKVNFDIGF